MKIDERIITAGMLFLLVFYITYRCSSSDPDKKIIVLRDHGVSIENPTIDPSNLIPQKADSTLISLRYVSRDKRAQPTNPVGWVLAH